MFVPQTRTNVYDACVLLAQGVRVRCLRTNLLSIYWPDQPGSNSSCSNNSFDQLAKWPAWLSLSLSSSLCMDLWLSSPSSTFGHMCVSFKHLSNWLRNKLLSYSLWLLQLPFGQIKETSRRLLSLCAIVQNDDACTSLALSFGYLHNLMLNYRLRKYVYEYAIQILETRVSPTAFVLHVICLLDFKDTASI